MINSVYKSIALQQQNFVNAIFSEDDESHTYLQEGLNIYRNNIKATAAQTLSTIFPTVVEQIGQQLMDYISQLLLVNQPPSRGDWAEWGIGLPNFLKALSVLNDYPFVAESAKLDLAVHQVERAADKWLEQESLQLLVDVNLDNLFIKLNDTVQFFSSPYPIVDLRNIDEFNSDHMSALKQKIETQTLQQNVLVCRPQYKAFIQAIEIEELEWLTLISKEISIGKSLDAMVNTNFDFAHWLPVALERNLISTLYKQ